MEVEINTWDTSREAIMWWTIITHHLQPWSVHTVAVKYAGSAATKELLTQMEHIYKLIYKLLSKHIY